jgi:putative aldouronate transport system permease protein
MILPLVVINLLLSLAYIMNADFGLFFQVTRDTSMLYPTTDVLDTYIYRSLIVTRDVSMAAAA